MVAGTSACAMFDCLIIGGGPAGLTAAVYLARFRREILVIDEGESRAKLIAESHNYPGFAGVSGPALLTRLTEQAYRHGAPIRSGRVTALRRGEHGSFRAFTNDSEIEARRVLLATGLVDERPNVGGLEAAIYQGSIRFCPICDAYEALDKRIGVIGPLGSAAPKALFLRTYSNRITLVAFEDETTAPAGVLDELHAAGVEVAHGAARVERTNNEAIVTCRDGRRLTLDVLYPALGCTVKSDLATCLGVHASDTGNICVNEHQRTSVRGLYCAGDVVSDLHQLSVAIGHAAIAATAIHNDLPRNHR
jgi:thioredoxin reductase (NADPH)